MVDGAVVVAKTGMGSSAALVSSLVGALLSFFDAICLPCSDGTSGLESTEGPAGTSPSDGFVPGPGITESLDLTHNLAQACHCVAQGKVSSACDNSQAVCCQTTPTVYPRNRISYDLLTTSPGEHSLRADRWR